MKQSARRTRLPGSTLLAVSIWLVPSAARPRADEQDEAFRPPGLPEAPIPRSREPGNLGSSTPTSSLEIVGTAERQADPVIDLSLG